MKRRAHVVGWVLLAMAAFSLWPERWGGTMTYVVTSGTSMEPAFEAGDLAVLRSAGEYRVGDVVAYRSVELERVVMHRIVERSPAGFTLQGDNNDFVDPSVVPQARVLGRLVLRVPAAGLVGGWIVKPINLLILGAALLLLMSDRRPSAPRHGASPSMRVVRVRALALPAGTATAEVASAEDLARLAEHYERPVLEVDGDDARYVFDGAVAYVWREPVQARVRPPAERRRTPQGRDWGYADEGADDGADADRTGVDVDTRDASAARHLVTVPSPRGAEQLVS